MNYEYSCGAVVFTHIDGAPHYLLVRAKDQPEGCHGFPKGHMEPGETELAGFVLAPFDEALALTEFADSKQILTEAHAFLTR